MEYNYYKQESSEDEEDDHQNFQDQEQTLQEIPSVTNINMIDIDNLTRTTDQYGLEIDPSLASQLLDDTVQISEPENTPIPFDKKDYYSFSDKHGIYCEFEQKAIEQEAHCIRISPNIKYKALGIFLKAEKCRNF